jgi:hypothetical protein
MKVVRNRAHCACGCAVGCSLDFADLLRQTVAGNQMEFLPLFLASAHRARVAAAILFLAAADIRRLGLGVVG